MLPVLFQIGPITLHTYGLMAALGFLFSVRVISYLSIQAKLPHNKMVDFAFYLLLAGFVGARALFVYTRWSSYQNDLLAVFKVWEGGLVFYGGLVTAALWGIWYARRIKLSIWKAMDVLLPGLTLGHAFGRFGCFAAGCCYGRPTDSAFGVRFHSDLVEASLRGIPLHPTQLYEAAALLTLFAGLLWVFRHRKFDGQVGLTYLMAYPIIRSIVEVFRGDLIRGFVVDDVLSTSQFISILVFLAAAIALVVRLKQVQRRSS